MRSGGDAGAWCLVGCVVWCLWGGQRTKVKWQSLSSGSMWRQRSVQSQTSMLLLLLRWLVACSLQATSHRSGWSGPSRAQFAKRACLAPAPHQLRPAHWPAC